MGVCTAEEPCQCTVTAVRLKDSGQVLMPARLRMRLAQSRSRGERSYPLVMKRPVVTVLMSCMTRVPVSSHFSPCGNGSTWDKNGGSSPLHTFNTDVQENQAGPQSCYDMVRNPGSNSTGAEWRLAAVDRESVILKDYKEAVEELLSSGDPTDQAFCRSLLAAGPRYHEVELLRDHQVDPAREQAANLRAQPVLLRSLREEQRMRTPDSNVPVGRSVSGKCDYSSNSNLVGNNAQAPKFTKVVAMTRGQKTRGEQTPGAGEQSEGETPEIGSERADEVEGLQAQLAASRSSQANLARQMAKVKERLRVRPRSSSQI